MSILEEGFKAQATTMWEFGYPDVTADMVRQHHEVWKQGHTAKDVVFAFSKGAFERYPDIFGKPD